MTLLAISDDFAVEACGQIHILGNNSGVATQPCIPDGGSPFRFYDYPRVTDAIFTGQSLGTRHHCGMTSQKSIGDGYRTLRRVDSLSTRNSSKAFSATPLPFSAFPRVYSAYPALRPGSVRYV